MGDFDGGNPEDVGKYREVKAINLDADELHIEMFIKILP